MVQQLEKNVIYSFGLAKKDIGRIQQDIIILNDNHQKMIRGMEDLRAEIEDLKRKLLAVSLKQESERKTVIVKESAPPKVNVIKMAPKTVTKTIVKVQRAKKHFIASKTGKKFHMPSCVFTKNIKPKMLLKFKTKKSALNKGFKPCDCVKK